MKISDEAYAAAADVYWRHGGRDEQLEVVAPIIAKPYVKQIKVVLSMHTPVPGGAMVCCECGKNYPCPTVLVLKKVD